MRQLVLHAGDRDDGRYHLGKVKRGGVPVATKSVNINYYCKDEQSIKQVNGNWINGGSERLEVNK